MFKKVILCPNCDAGMFSATKARVEAHSLLSGKRSTVAVQGPWTCGVCKADFHGGHGFEGVVEDFDAMVQAVEGFKL